MCLKLGILMTEWRGSHLVSGNLVPPRQSTHSQLAGFEFRLALNQRNSEPLTATEQEKLQRRQPPRGALVLDSREKSVRESARSCRTQCLE